MLVSIVIPSFNQGDYIRECIESLLDQKRVDLEVFLYDSLSDDNTVDVLREYQDRIRIFVEKDLGQSHAINKGLCRSQGEILGFLNSDDFLLPEALSKVVEYWKRYPDTDLLYGKAHYVDKCSKVVSDYRTSEWNGKVFHGECFICQPSCFWSHRIMKRIGLLDQRLDCCLDYDYWLRIAGANGVVKHIEDYLSCSRDYGETKTRSRRKEIFREIFSLSLKRLGYVNRSWIKQWINYLKYEELSFLTRLLPANQQSQDAVAKAGEILSHTLAKDTYFVEPVPDKVV